MSRLDHMDRRFKYLWNKQVVYRRYPITDIPDEETEHYMFYKSGTHQCYDFVNRKMNFQTRDRWLVKNLKTSYCVKHVFTHFLIDESTTKLVHQKNLEAGYEGSIVRLNTPYQCKRSHSLRKFKDFQDAEATIVGYEEGKGKRTGTLGKFLMQDDDGNQFGCPPGKGHNYKDLARMLIEIHKYMGQRATFTYFERTKAGSYRHPLFKCIRNYE